MRGQRIHDSVFLAVDSESYIPKACLPEGLKWEKTLVKEDNMLEIGVSIGLAQKCALDLQQAEQQNFATMDSILQVVEKLVSTGKVF